LSVRGLEAGEDIVQMAEERKADEIIIGIQRKSKVGKLLFGSTAQYIILRAPCPVLTVQ
jgi:nucleotide-binding universal stress UspA family protein